MAVARRSFGTGAAAVLVALAAAPPLRAGEHSGAYCPLPEKGETPRCLTPAVAEYDEFFAALDHGELSDAAAARVERDVASGAQSDPTYLAISSLAYGYFRLSQRAVEDPDQDPAVVARLQRWNDLLARVYDESTTDPAYRAAVRHAAEDIHDRAPPVQLACADERGDTVACDSTEAVLRGIDRARDRVGIRGALGHLIDRIFGGEDS